MSGPVGFSIGSASLQSGLSTHVIRAWERRYGAIIPARTPSGRRSYSHLDIDRLILLKNVVASGYSISQVAELDDDKLMELSEMESHRRGIASTTVDHNPENLLNVCMEAVAMLDSTRLNRQLQRGLSILNRYTMITDVIQPLMERIGRQWAAGDARIVHGHMAAGMVHAHLSAMLTHRAEGDVGNPLVMVAAPAGQHCFLGALAIAALAQDYGWNSAFMGYNLPAEEIAAAATALMPQRIVVSITCRTEDAFMNAELLRLAELVGGRFVLMVGGRAGHFYQQLIEANGGTICYNIENLFEA
jgi:DNA-binding transcriptional MerR regulator/methylmalonyl-CoA mutase cobalamin-binding subunit